MEIQKRITPLPELVFEMICKIPEISLRLARASPRYP